ncbi:MAG: hypothetical protein RLN76_13510 [Phycisphaeraceae bacterium]
MTSEEARRAIYLDFEGFQQGPPLMAGVLLEEAYTGTVFPDVSPLIRLAGEAKGLEAVDLERFLRDLALGPHREAGHRGLLEPREERDREARDQPRRRGVRQSAAAG